MYDGALYIGETVYGASYHVLVDAPFVEGGEFQRLNFDHEYIIYFSLFGYVFSLILYYIISISMYVCDVGRFLSVRLCIPNV